MLTNKRKTIVRWSGIMFVSCCYFIVLHFSKRSFFSLIEKESMRVSGAMTISEYSNAINIVQVQSEVIDKVGFLGFFICIALILFIFKKVR
ncbi:hypothetical protein KCQ_19592 [Pectobacterium atrosepticum ICMP 1526]|nr:hypothetical protein EV46_07700 [Pectobacterium atrosepticum]KMK79601.1 hypothetical protein KCQ_19592 [Pectobacterium atrosepticum ICMP 1526]ATY90289.1 hypothetical protein CVS35_07935 [Pectobacterium atrosepticum]KFX16502.1 hypothetical protein JV34_06885 [Pectobacterium atrosepticum]KFX24704.1 hypothetical protein KP24_06515 [Pectobacterium atrosepticum]